MSHAADEGRRVPPCRAGGSAAAPSRPALRCAVLRRLVHLLRAPGRRCPRDCGRDDPPADYRDRSFADGSVSPDQARIADALPALLAALGPSARMLHVGVGCSDLAVRFAGRLAHLDGITVLPDEAALADALGFPNYTVFTMNKHGRGLDALAGPYALVVDNNPGSFTCCVRHVRALFEGYARVLAPGGRVLTDERGARWRQAGGYRVSWRRWARQGRAVGLVPERITATVWALRKPRTARGG